MFPQNQLASAYYSYHNEEKLRRSEMADAKAHGLTSSFELFGKSKELVMKNLPAFGALLAIPFLLALFGEFSADSNTTTSSGPFAGASISGAMLGAGLLLSIVFILATMFATIMLTGLSLDSTEGKKPTLSQLWPYVSKYGVRYIGVSLATGFMILIGLLALIVPGIIMIRRYILAPYVMMDQDLSIGESMKESARISKPHSGYVWGVIGVSVLIALIAIIPVVGWIVSFVLSSFYTVAPALRYKELKQLEGAAGHAHHAATE